MRVHLFRALHSSLKASGTLFLTAYFYSLLQKLFRRKQEGFHEGHIFYHRFTASEVRAELGGGFRMVETRPLHPDRRVLASLPGAGSWARQGILGRCLAQFVGRLLFIRVEKQMVEMRWQG